MGEWDRIIDVTLAFVIVTFLCTMVSVILVPIYVKEARDDAQNFLDTLPELEDMLVLVNGTIPESFFTDASGKIRFSVRANKICWDANNNIPFLQTICIPGAYYIVTTPGTTVLGPHGGASDPWYIGTQLVCTGGGWIKIEPDNLEYPADMNVPGGIAGLDLAGFLFPWQIPVLFLQGMSFLGGWDANTNTPALFSGLCINGDIYVVTIAGNTIIDGQGTWEVGEAVVCDGVNSFVPVWKRVTGMFFSLSEVLTSGEATDPGGSIIMGSAPIVAASPMTASLNFVMPSYADCVASGCDINIPVAIASDGFGHLYDYQPIPKKEHTSFHSNSFVTNAFTILTDWFGNNAVSDWDLESINPWLGTGIPTFTLAHPTAQDENFFNFDHGVIALNLNPSKSWAFNGGHAQTWRTVHFRAMGIMVNSPLLTGQQNAVFGPIFRIRVSNFKPGPYFVHGLTQRVQPALFPSYPPNPRADITYAYLLSSSFAMPCNDIGIEETSTPGLVLITVKCWPIRFSNSSPGLDNSQIMTISMSITHMVA